MNEQKECISLIYQGDLDNQKNPIDSEYQRVGLVIISLSKFDILYGKC
jgi:hypothetical protein